MNVRVGDRNYCVAHEYIGEAPCDACALDEARLALRVRPLHSCEDARRLATPPSARAAGAGERVMGTHLIDKTRK